MGKVVARQPGSVLSDNPEEAEAATRFEMYRNAIYDRNLHAQAYIEPARYQINLEHSVRINDILSIVEIASIFDENTLFDLKCLLVEHAGSNLRNPMAHGLISDGEFMSPLMS